MNYHANNAASRWSLSGRSHNGCDGKGNHPLVDTPPTAGKDPGEVFMLHELDNVRSFLQEDTSIDERRMDVLILLISGMGAGLGLLTQAGVDHVTLLYIMLVICATLPVITIPVFIDTIARDISAVDYIRAVNMVREYFAMRTPTIRPYLLMPGSGPFPRYGGVSSNRRILTLITGTALALLPLVARLLVYHEAHPDVFTVLVTLITFIILVAIHWVFWRYQYRKANYDAERYGSSALAGAERARLRRVRAQKQRFWRRHSGREQHDSAVAPMTPERPQP